MKHQRFNKTRSSLLRMVLPILGGVFVGSAGVADAAILHVNVEPEARIWVVTAPAGALPENGQSSVVQPDSEGGLTCPLAIGASSDTVQLCGLDLDGQRLEPSQVRWLPNAETATPPRPIPICLLKIPIEMST